MCVFVVVVVVVVVCMTHISDEGRGDRGEFPVQRLRVRIVNLQCLFYYITHIHTQIVSANVHFNIFVKKNHTCKRLRGDM